MVVECTSILLSSRSSDPTRRLIIERAARGSLSVNELAEPFGILPAGYLASIWRIPERAGLVEKRREGRQQFCCAQAGAAARGIRLDRRNIDSSGTTHSIRLDILLTDLKRQPKERKPHARKTKSSTR